MSNETWTFFHGGTLLYRLDSPGVDWVRSFIPPVAYQVPLGCGVGAGYSGSLARVTVLFLGVSPLACSSRPWMISFTTTFSTSYTARATVSSMAPSSAFHMHWRWPSFSGAVGEQQASSCRVRGSCLLRIVHPRWKTHWKAIFSATKRQALTLAKFVAIYKFCMIIAKRANGGVERDLDSFFGGSVAGYFVFRDRSAITEQASSSLLLCLDAETDPGGLLR